MKSKNVFTPTFAQRLKIASKIIDPKKREETMAKLRREEEERQRQTPPTK